MPNVSDEFARYAKAERRLHDEAAPVLAALIRTIEVQAGLCITEMRVTVDWANALTARSPRTAQSFIAHNASTSDGHGPLYSPEPPGGGLSPSQD